MSSTATESLTSTMQNAVPQKPLGGTERKMPTGYYFLVLFSPLILGLGLVISGLLMIVTGVLLILAAPIFLIVGPFIIPRRVSPDDPRWGYKVILDKNVNSLRDWVRNRVIGNEYFRAMGIKAE